MFRVVLSGSLGAIYRGLLNQLVIDSINYGSGDLCMIQTNREMSDISLFSDSEACIRRVGEMFKKYPMTSEGECRRVNGVTTDWWSSGFTGFMNFSDINPANQRRIIRENSELNPERKHWAWTENGWVSDELIPQEADEISPVEEVLSRLVDAGERLRSTAIVDDDFAEVRHVFDETLSDARHFLSDTELKSKIVISGIDEDLPPGNYTVKIKTVKVDGSTVVTEADIVKSE